MPNSWSQDVISKSENFIQVFRFGSNQPAGLFSHTVVQLTKQQADALPGRIAKLIKAENGVDAASAAYIAQASNSINGAPILLMAEQQSIVIRQSRTQGFSAIIDESGSVTITVPSDLSTVSQHGFDNVMQGIAHELGEVYRVQQLGRFMRNQADSIHGSGAQIYNEVLAEFAATGNFRTAFTNIRIRYFDHFEQASQGIDFAMQMLKSDRAWLVANAVKVPVGVEALSPEAYWAILTALTDVDSPRVFSAAVRSVTNESDKAAIVVKLRRAVLDLKQRGMGNEFLSLADRRMITVRGVGYEQSIRDRLTVQLPADTRVYRYQERGFPLLPHESPYFMESHMEYSEDMRLCM
jgi:hypothetical protein